MTYIAHIRIMLCLWVGLVYDYLFRTGLVKLTLSTKSCRSFLFSLVLVFSCTLQMYGSTIVPPADYGEMVHLSDVVITATIGDSESIVYGGVIYTRTTLSILHVFKGTYAVGQTVQAYHLGGFVDGFTAVVSGSPALRRGDVMLLSLRASGIGLSMWLLSYGQLRLEILADGTQVYKHLDSSWDIEYEPRESVSIEMPGIYRKSQLEDHLTSILAGNSYWDSWSAGSIWLVTDTLLTPKVVSNGIRLPAGCSMLDANGGYSRWKSLDGTGTVKIFTHAEASLADRDAIQQSLKNWGGIAGTNLSDIQYGGLKSLPKCDASGLTNPIRTQVLGENELFVVYNDPCGNLEPAPNCVGILATAQHFVSNQKHIHRGAEWANMSKGIVIVNKGIQSCLTAAKFQQTVQHEIGHLLGFGHHTIEPANMNAACCNPLTVKDTACAQFVYSTMQLNATPVIARIIPDIVPQGTTVVISIEGAGFMPESVVAIGGSDVQIQATRYIHENRMEVAVVVLRSAIPSSRAFRVTNPTPGGGRSEDMAFTVTASTAIPERDQNGVPYAYELGDNFPNPFNPETVIPFEIPWQTWVRMSLIDASGRTLRILIDREFQAGRHRQTLRAEHLPSGLYLVSLETEIGIKTKKITIIK